MSSKTQFFAKLEKILTFLKNSKLEYLKASDRFNLPQNKRFFNMQATLRNRFFQDIASLLRSMNVEMDNLVINKLNFEQIVTSSNTKINQSHLEKSRHPRDLMDLAFSKHYISSSQKDKVTAIRDTLVTLFFCLPKFFEIENEGS